MSLPLLHSPARILEALLIEIGQCAEPSDSGTASWPAYAGFEPAAPDEVITCYGTTPLDDGRIMTSGEKPMHRAGQVRVRSQTENAGAVKVDAIRVALNESVYQQLVTIDGTQYLIDQVSAREPIPLGIEAGVSTRWLFTLNVLWTMIRLN